MVCKIGIRLTVEGSLGKKQTEIENECELHDSLPPSTSLLFCILSPAFPMSPSPFLLSFFFPPSLQRDLTLTGLGAHNETKSI